MPGWALDKGSAARLDYMLDPPEGQVQGGQGTSSEGLCGPANIIRKAGNKIEWD